MVGISYPGISQLFVAALQPPHLAAIAPLSVIADTGRGTLCPGGILNNGFAHRLGGGSQARRRGRAERAGLGGDRIDDGDSTCATNQGCAARRPTCSR